MTYAQFVLGYAKDTSQAEATFNTEAHSLTLLCCACLKASVNQSVSRLFHCIRKRFSLQCFWVQPALLIIIIMHNCKPQIIEYNTIKSM